jgi:hypothetical protein
MQTIVYKVQMVNAGSTNDIVFSLKEMYSLEVWIVTKGIVNEIHINVPNDFTLTDALSLGSYIGQIETLQLIK